jgi:hypothetical protein
MPRPANVIVALIGCGLLVFTLGSIEAGSSSSYTCAVCRLGRADTTLFGFTRSTHFENECSRWYPENAERSHKHVWARGGCSRLLNGFGRKIGFACGPSQSPIWWLPSATQSNVYKHIKDGNKAKVLFSSLANPNTYNEQFDGSDERRGDLIVTCIVEWEIAGFPGTWDDWWNGWRKKHEAETVARKD